MDKEVIPLMSEQYKDNKYSSKIEGINNPAYNRDLGDIVNRKEYWEKELDEDKLLFSDERKRGTSLIWNDFIILTVEYLQWLALIQSLALRWPWPEKWIASMRGLFIVSVDAWELTKILSNQTYKSIQGYSTASLLMPYQFWELLVAWAVIIAVILFAYILAYGILTKQNHPYLMVKIANMQRVYIIAMQLLALPLGLTLGKVFHCVPAQIGNQAFMDVDNKHLCLSAIHWAYMAAAAGVFLVFFLGFSIWLIKKTRIELIFIHSSGHEAYLQLKETEYIQGLDMLYTVSAFHIFSSFKLRSAHFRAAMHLLKFLAILVYSLLFYYTHVQALTLTALMLVYFVSFAILRPFRVKAFNVLLVISFFCLLLNLLTGALRSSFDAYSLRSVWFTPEYILYILVIINGGWLVMIVSLFIYFLLHQFNCVSKAIWPSLTSEGIEKLDEQTKKYIRAVLIARHVVERSMSVSALFAPAHELSRHIQIINAYCREAELLGDPFQDTLWHLLDELIEVHSQVAPRSLFSESVKESIRVTAEELMRMMPQFVKRLAQREYDFLLVSPVKRRILLKLYCMGLFLNGRSERIRFRQLNQPQLDRMWTKDKALIKKSTNHLIALIPSSEMGPRVAQNDPMANDSLSFLDEDADSYDVNKMMRGIPSAHSTSLTSPSKPTTRDISPHWVRASPISNRKPLTAGPTRESTADDTFSGSLYSKSVVSKLETPTIQSRVLSPLARHENLSSGNHSEPQNLLSKNESENDSIGSAVSKSNAEDGPIAEKCAEALPSLPSDSSAEVPTPAADKRKGSASSTSSRSATKFSEETSAEVVLPGFVPISSSATEPSNQ